MTIIYLFIYLFIYYYYVLVLGNITVRSNHYL